MGKGRLERVAFTQNGTLIAFVGPLFVKTVANTPLPADAVTRSASGLDPDISPANARLQAPRVAKARGISPQQVNDLVDQEVTPRWLGIIGEPRLNVLRINLRLDELKSGK